MSTVVATVSLEPPRSGLGLEVLFSFPGTGRSVYLPLPDRHLLDALREKAGMYLERLVPLVARLNPSLEDARGALRVLLASGRELAGLLTRYDRDRLLQLQAAFREAWPVWQAADWNNPDGPLPTVEVLCHDQALPLELLPLFDFGTLPPVRTAGDLIRAANRFLGYTTVVRRVTAAPASGDRVLRNDPVLPLQFMRHRGLASAAEEERFLTGLDGYVRVEGPWPLSQDGSTVREALIRALYDGATLDGGPPGDPPVQVQHFACHCDTSGDPDDDYTLTLSTRRGSDRSISFGQLRAGYYDRFFANPDGTGHRAVIVLNACASSRTSPTTAFSFPQWFLSFGHRAFVGTETFVPDAVAGRFAVSFYGRLLERRRPLGEAVVWARRDLLRDFRNPLGLLYVLYGDADLTVERARPEISRAGVAATGSG